MDKVTIDGKEYLVTKSGGLWPTPLRRISVSQTPSSSDDDTDKDRERSIRQDVINASFCVE